MSFFFIQKLLYSVVTSSFYYLLLLYGEQQWFFFFKALQLLEVSEVTILSTTRIFVIIIASILILHEPFSLQKALGTIFIMIATFLVTNRTSKMKFNIGIMYTFFMVLFGGIALVIDSLNVKHYDPIFYNSIQNLLSGLFLLVIVPKALKDWKHFFTLPLSYECYLLLSLVQFKESLILWHL